MHIFTNLNSQHKPLRLTSRIVSFMLPCVCVLCCTALHIEIPYQKMQIYARFVHSVPMGIYSMCVV